MHVKRSHLFYFVLLIMVAGCHFSHPVISNEAAYLESMEMWKRNRLERLKGENGWLNLAGLFWLKEGENRFGSDPSNDIVFPDKAEPFCGVITLKNGQASLEVKEGVEITSGGKPVTMLDLRDDHSKPVTTLRQGDLAWYIIKRGDKYGIRLRDYRHPRIRELDHIPSYPVQADYVVEATLRPFAQPETITVATPVEGYSESYQCPGELHFTLKHKKLKLLPFSEGNGYFLVFADETTGLETYGAGRFFYTEPDSTGRILLDFNKAYNPPCAFTPFATCPMPPRENFLDFPIKAGEKAVHPGSH